MSEKNKDLQIINEEPVFLISVGQINTDGADRLLKVIERKIFELDLENKEVNEDTVKEIKTIRADLNRELATIKAGVRSVKEKFNEPIKVLDEKVKVIYDKLETTSHNLGQEIKEYEDNLKLKKENELRLFFEETKKLTNERLNDINENVDFVDFVDVGLNITLTASLISLQRQITDHFENRYNDMLIVNTNPNSDRLRVKYLQLKHLGQALVEVQKDVAVEEKLREQRNLNNKNEVKENEPETPIIERKETVAKVLEMSFKVWGTKEELREIKNFLIINDIKFE